jgi:hypothetical protein
MEADTMEAMEMDTMVEDTVGEQRQEAWLTREQELASFLFARNNYLKEHEHEPVEHDMYEGEDAGTKMMHLMHSDTMTVVIALIVMICVGLLFRSLCLRLTRDKTRKERIRGGLKALADHMNSVTRSMSNDPNPDSPRAVMRTYSSYGRGEKPGAPVEESDISSHKGKYPNVRTMSRENLRVQAFSNILSKEGVCQPSSEKVHRGALQVHNQGDQAHRQDHQVTIEMTACPRTR